MNLLSKQVALTFVFASSSLAASFTTVLTENFDNVNNLPGWIVANNSAPLGSTSYFQGNPGIFPSHSGLPNSYVAANFLNAAAGGDISDWLISPPVFVFEGATIGFYSRTTASPAVAPDRLELRLSRTAGSSTGTTAASVGDFGELLLSVNPGLSPTGYPGAWTLYTATLSGFSDFTPIRFAFRYTVPDTFTNGDYIGIDSVQVDSFVPEPATFAGAAIALALIAASRRRFSERRSTR
jgi:hypothetical protein